MFKTLILAMALVFSTSAFAATQKLQAKSGVVYFVAIGKPGFLKIRGESKESSPQIVIQINGGHASGEGALTLSGLDTGISLRNQHMKEKYLEIAKYPKATFTLDSVSASDSELKSGLNKAFTGKLTLHGVTRPITGNFEYKPNGELKASFSFNVSDFKIEIPSYMGVTVSEKVEVEVNASMTSAIESGK